MKKENVLLYICIALSAVNIFAIMRQSYQRQSTNSVSGTSPLMPVTTSTVTDLFIPNELSFAGEPVPLHRRDVKEALEKELIVNSYLHSHTSQILKAAPRTFAIIEPILKANGIPDDFKYLAVIESRLDPQIVSPAGAVGIWQIMKDTGKELGLEINNEVDERYHITRSTEAASAYLKKSYEQFGSWTLAAASYNGGNNFLKKQMKAQEVDNYYNLLLGEETERYVFRILALKQIMNHPEKYNFDIVNPYPSEPVDTVTIDTTVRNWTDFAHKNGITYKTLKRFNPWLRKTELHNPKHKTYHIIIPRNKKNYQ